MAFLIALLFSVVLVPLARMLALRVGAVDRPIDQELKIHDRPVPVVGGIAALVACLLSFLLADGSLPLSILLACMAALLIGTIDDMRPIGAPVRVVAQIGWASLLLFGWVDPGEVGVLPAIGFIALVLTCVNAVNMVDGQDGLAGGLAAIAGAGLAGILEIGGGVSDFELLSLTLSGGLVGFVCWNVSRYRIFMGDGGAYTLGTLLAVLCAVAITEQGWQGLFAVGLCMGIFAFEFIFTFGRRALTGGSLLGGDRDHSYDLLASGERRRITVTIWFWVAGAAASGLGVLAASASLRISIMLTLVFYACTLSYGFVLWHRRLRQPNSPV